MFSRCRSLRRHCVLCSAGPVSSVAGQVCAGVWYSSDCSHDRVFICGRNKPRKHQAQVKNHVFHQERRRCACVKKMLVCAMARTALHRCLTHSASALSFQFKSLIKTHTWSSASFHQLSASCSVRTPCQIDDSVFRTIEFSITSTRCRLCVSH